MPNFRIIERALLAPVLCLTLATARAGLEPRWVSLQPSPESRAIEVLMLQDDQGAWWVRDSEYANWEIGSPQGTRKRWERSQWISLDEQPGLRHHFDQSTQSILLEPAAAMRPVQMISPRRQHDQEPDPVESGSWLDASIGLESRSSALDLNSLLDWRMFSGHALLSNTALAGTRRNVRLDTQWRFDNPQDLRSSVFGDGIVDSGSWGRAARFGGISYGTDFSIRPDLVTFPRPEVTGLAELPSTVDVYVNGILQRRSNIESGPFVLQDIPLQVGANQTRVVVRNALGAEQVMTQAFYAPTNLLASGLTHFKLDAGFLRRDYAIDSFRYGSAFVSGHWRRGISNSVTLESRGELEGHRQAAGLAVTTTAPIDGLIEIAVAASVSEQQAGTSLRFAYDWNSNRGLSLGARLRHETGGWSDLGSVHALRRREQSLNAGFICWPGASASLTWVRREDELVGQVDVASMSLTTRLSRNWQLSTTVTRLHSEAIDTADSQLLALNLVGTFGRNSAVTYAHQGQAENSYGAEWHHNGEALFDPSYRIRSNRSGDSDRLFAEHHITREQGTLDTVVAHDEHGAALRSTATTRLAWIGEDYMISRAGYDGLAIVDTGGLANVRVMHDHRLAGRTNQQGLAVIPGLRPFEVNRLQLVVADVPIEANVESLEKSVVPAGRGATRVSFPVSKAPGTLLQILLPDGTPVPAGARVWDPRSGKRIALGLNGQSWWPHPVLPEKLKVSGTSTHSECEGRPSTGASNLSVVKLACLASN